MGAYVRGGEHQCEVSLIFFHHCAANQQQVVISQRQVTSVAFGYSVYSQALEFLSSDGSFALYILFIYEVIGLL